jgi:DNA-binding GntR family transcriptional regulator
MIDHMTSAADKVFSEIVTAILTGAMHPREVVSERDLVERFGVSRTPVRESIKRLIERGFLESGTKGVRVVQISRDELRQLYDLRVWLEEYAAALTVEHIRADEIEELERVNQQYARALENRDLVQMLEVRAAFHATVARATRNRWLAEVLIHLRDKAYMVRHLHWQDIERAAQTLETHTRMIEALRRRDTATYAALVVDQIRAGITWYLNTLCVPEPILAAPADNRNRTALKRPAGKTGQRVRVKDR